MLTIIRGKKFKNKFIFVIINKFYVSNIKLSLIKIIPFINLLYFVYLVIKSDTENINNKRQFWFYFIYHELKNNMNSNKIIMVGIKAQNIFINFYLY